MATKYIVYEDSWSERKWTCNDFKTASIMANDFEKAGLNPSIYQLVYANGEMQNGKK